MKNLIIVILSLVGTVACGRAPEKDLGEFAPYVSSFEQKSQEVGAPIQVTDLKMRFGDLQAAQEDGVCEIKEGETPTITIDQTAWSVMDETTREAVVFHELGHCVLKRVHDNTLDKVGMPVSLMYPTQMDSSIYSLNQVQYNRELFQKRGQF